MKILHLYLKNFAHIFSGLGKYEIDLDFTKSNKVINVIIGKMGTCKTVILGSLQPFASFGTLDVRNQDDLILSEVDGLKIIEYSDGSDIYKITHQYIWTKTSHTTKSYIEKNGNELNPNGNQASFKMIIENEMGIEQNFLRLLRLGANVSNVINMKSTERKTFIASLLKDAEVYTSLYKKLYDDMKTLNAQVTLLTNKLSHIGLDHEGDIQKEYDSNLNKIESINEDYTAIKTKIFELRGIIQSILKDMTYDDYINQYKGYCMQSNALHNQIDEINNTLNQFHDSPSIIEISKIIGGLDKSIEQTQKKINESEAYYQDLGIELSKLVDNKKIVADENKLDDLQKTYESLLHTMEDYKSEISNFNSTYNVTQITQLIGNLNTIDLLVDDIAQYDNELIKRIYSSDSTIITWSKKQIEFLNARKIKLQKDINNIRYSEKYESPVTLFIPPFCPTTSCPFYQSHPFNIQKKNEKSNTDDNTELDRIMGEVDALDIKISKYEAYPIIFSKMMTVKTLWKQNYFMVDKLHATKANSLLVVLTNLQYRHWYDYDKLSKIVELSQKRDHYYELVENLTKVKAEIQSIELSKDASVDEKITYLEKEIDNTIESLSVMEEELKSYKTELIGYNDLYLKLSKLSEYESEKIQLTSEYSKVNELITSFEENLDEVNTNQKLLEHLQTDEVELHNKLKDLTEKNEHIKTVLNDLSYTKDEFNTIIEKRNVLKYILDAVSSKEGIPLVMVEMFLNNCKDVVNELISDVFGDMIEIQKFKINENEFKIPYTINGVKVEDIEKASQGQQAVISIALSFALVRQSLFKYNIMLLDEIDGPLYKHDRSKFVTILMKQLQAINGEQVFLISHNTEIFNQMNINYVCTTNEMVDQNDTNSVIYV